MSRIEDAMEKAGRLREQAAFVKQAAPVGRADAAGRTAVAQERPSISPHDRPAEVIEISSPRLVSANDYNLPVAEEYRKLKSAVVQLTSGDKNWNTLMVTSSVGGEGKSVTALNLAISLSQEYDRSVILVDADLRNPSICRYLGLNRRAGLADCLMDDVDLDDVLINTGLGSLLLLPAGKEVANPVEVLASQKMKDFLEQIKRRYPGYYIIFDISPTLPFAESRVIGNMVDGVVFVVKEGGTSPKNIFDSLEALGSTNILGLVYNKATTAGLSGGYHYYYYDYDYKLRGTVPPEKQKTNGVISRLLQRVRPKRGD